MLIINESRTILYTWRGRKGQVESLFHSVTTVIGLTENKHYELKCKDKSRLVCACRLLLAMLDIAKVRLFPRCGS